MTNPPHSPAIDVVTRVLELGEIGFGTADRTGTLLFANPVLAQILGRDALPGTALHELGLVPDEPHATTEERLIQRPDGTGRWALLTVVALGEGPGTPARWLLTLRDIDVIKQAQATARAQDAQLADFAQFARVGVIRVDLGQGIILDVNDALAAMYGFEREELIDRDWRTLTELEQSADVDELGFEPIVDRFSDGSLTTTDVERVVIRRDGRPMRIRAVAAVSPGPDGEPRYLTTICEDITAQHAAAEQLRYDALHDALTGLANRTQFGQLIDEARARPERAMAAVLFLDLDQFKLVNDALGHVVGDQLLRAVAERLTAAARPSETVTRFGGDEFVVFCDGVGRTDAASEIGRRLLGSLRAPFTVGGRRVFVTASLGISLATELDPERMLREADSAMYRAKGAGPDRIAVFNPGLLEASDRELALAAQLHEAIAADQFTLEYQPIVELTSGRLAALEALLRWHHPERGLIGPAEFIPIAERTGIITRVGSWVLTRACADAARWRRRHPEITLHVNVSPAQLVDTLPGEVSEALRSSGMSAQGLVLEVTEAAMLPAAMHAGIPAALRQLGVMIALDDFGTGYSCLAFLDRLPLDGLKIDRQFVSRLGSAPAPHAIIESILALARACGLDTIGEGIETSAQLEELRALGCGFGQGFYFSRPVGHDRLDALIDAPPWASARR